MRQLKMLLNLTVPDKDFLENLVRSVLFPCFFSKSRNGCLSCFDQAAQCRWPSFREGSKLTFASSMKTAAVPLKAQLLRRRRSE